MLGDINKDGIVNLADLTLLSKAVALNYIHSKRGPDEDISEHKNGGLSGESAVAASLHKTGYVSNVDTIIMTGYLEYKVEHPTATLSEYIEYADSETPGRDRESLINFIDQQLAGFKTYQMRHYYINGSPSTKLGEVCTLFALVHVYLTHRDYLGSLTDAELEHDADVVQEAIGIEPPDTKAGWQKSVYELYNDVNVKAVGLSQAQIDAIKADYYPAGSVPETVTAEQLSARIRSDCAVDAAVEFDGRSV